MGSPYQQRPCRHRAPARRAPRKPCKHPKRPRLGHRAAGGRAGGLLHQRVHGRAAERRAEVERLALVGQAQAAGDVGRARAHQVLRQRHHVVVVRVRLPRARAGTRFGLRCASSPHLLTFCTSHCQSLAPGHGVVTCALCGAHVAHVFHAPERLHPHRGPRPAGAGCTSSVRWESNAVLCSGTWTGVRAW